MTITFIGHGYVGLVTASIFADLGNTVWVVGRTKEKIEKLKKGIAPFYEPGLEEMVSRNVAAGRLIFTLNYQEAIEPSSIIFICVGTPPKPSGEADLSSVFASAESIGKVMSGYKVVVTKSTVPPGTNKKVGEILDKSKQSGASYAIASCPEFLREGTAISDTLHPDRIVIGTTSKRAEQLLIELHKPIDGKLVLSNVETAELIKYASNSFLATKISFANAIAILSEKVGADVARVLDGVGLDSRIGKKFLYPGVGYGGSCFPKDVKALIALSKVAGYDFALLRDVDAINKDMQKLFLKKIAKHFKNNYKGKTIAVLGLSFKPNTDDMREAPSVGIITSLLESGAIVRAYDPVATENAKTVLPKGVVYAQSAYEASKGADAVVIITEWNEFQQLDLVKLAKEMSGRVLFDGRNIYEPEYVRGLGFEYYGVGRM
jgi:UDPglucose 6-dehydrogenase